MKFSEEFLRKIKERVSLVEIVGEHVVLRKAGSNHVGLCPFHSERSPSFSVSETKHLFHCYGCKKGGDLFRFVMDMRGLSFPEAVEELAERARVPLPAGITSSEGESPEQQARRQAQRERTNVAHRLNRFAAAFFHQNLGGEPKAYVERRGLTPEAIRNFYVGYAPEGWDALTQHLIKAKAPLPVAVELGLIRPSPPGARSTGGHFDLFRNRVVFPILDLRGKVAGFGGRAIGEGETPKYLNSPESMLFQKSRLLYGLFQAQKFIREADVAIVVEGYFDVVTLHAAGIGNVVATCGTSLTPDHLQILKRFASKVIVLFDADRAGISATQRAMELGLDQGQILYSADLPQGKDPDEMVLEGRKEELLKILAEARPLLDSEMNALWESHRSEPEKQAQAIKKMAGWLHRFADPVGRQVRIQRILQEFRVPTAVLRASFEALGARTTAGTISAQQSAPISNPVKVAPVAKRKASAHLTPAEKVLLQGLALGGEFSEQLAKGRSLLPSEAHLVDLWDHPPTRELVARMSQEAGFLERFRKVPESVLSEIEDLELRSLLTETWMTQEQGKPAFEASEFHYALGSRLKKAWARFSHEIRTQAALAEAAKDAELQAKWMKEYLDVQRKMKEFSAFYDEV